MSRVPLAALGLATVLLAIAVPASAFHHAFTHGAACGESDFSGGNNPTARDALIEHNRAQDLPLPPAGTPADQGPITDCPAPGK